MKLKLTVQAARRDDVFQDVIRIPEAYRKGTDGNVVPEGKLCWLRTGSAAVLVIARGNSDQPDAADIWLDERTRNRLAVRRHDSAEFELYPVGWFRHVQWALTASDTGYRIASWIALTSVALGLLGFFLGVLSLYLSWK